VQTVPAPRANLHKTALNLFQLRLYPYHSNVPRPFLFVR
jgi:hypothetical protein